MASFSACLSSFHYVFSGFSGKMKSIILLFKLLIALLLCVNAACKECTNVPTPLASHTYRAELLLSKNQSWRHEVFSYYHLIHTDEATWANLLPRKMLREQDEFDWAMMYKQLKHSGGSDSIPSEGFLREISLHDVRLDPSSIHWRAQQTNLEYLMLLDVDSLVWSFRKTAGLATPGKPYGGWEDQDCELRGHFVGHYLSATAQMWASTHNDSLKEKMSTVVSAMSACQEQMGSGYLSAFPSELFDRFEAIRPVWAPYYTIHKILAGLLDQYIFAGNEQALKMVTWMVDYFYKRVQNVISKYTIERHWMSLNEEVGGMNDVLYKLYIITNNPKHLVLAHLFDKPCFLGRLALQVDDLSGFHANTHIPVVVGAQMRYEVTGDPLYKVIGTYFMEIVNSSHSYATGGTSVGEFWRDPKRLATILDTENEESCTTYNMLKVSRHLFRWTKEAAYADYYERALTNGVLTIQRGTDPGVMIYMLPLGRGVSKAASFHGWGTMYDSFWCCYGTGIESFSKLGNSIYFEEQGQTPGLYIIQYISSSLDWGSGKMGLSQIVDPVASWDPSLRVKFGLSINEWEAMSSTLNFRIPSWTDSDSAKAELNGQSLTLPASGNFLAVTWNWSSTDVLTLELPISIRTEAIQDDRAEYASVRAILYGPYLLAGLSNGDWDIDANATTPHSGWISPVPPSHNPQLVTLSQESRNSTFVVSVSNQTIIMEEKFPEPGTNRSVHATFRLVKKDLAALAISSPKEAIGESVMLEPFGLSGMAIVQNGEHEKLAVEEVGIGPSFFRLSPGLDGNPESVSLESESQKGCYMYSGADYSSGAGVVLNCSPDLSDPNFKRAASFKMNGGISRYHPISFVATGLKRDFLLAPLMSMQDEQYTVYFNFRG